MRLNQYCCKCDFAISFTHTSKYFNRNDILYGCLWAFLILRLIGSAFCCALTPKHTHIADACAHVRTLSHTRKGSVSGNPLLFQRELKQSLPQHHGAWEKTSYGIIKLNDIVSDYSALFVFILELLSKCLRHRHIINYVHCEMTHLSTCASLLNQVISCLVVVCVKAVQYHSQELHHM